MLPRDQIGIGAPPTTEMHCLTTMAYWMMTIGNLALPPAVNSDQDHQEPPSPPVVELAPPAFGLLSVVYAAIFDPIAAPLPRRFRVGNPPPTSICMMLSDQLFRQNMADRHHKTFIAVDETFNEYVRPPNGAFWKEEA
eukprot:scaffold45252_cov24-Cyclotella_meneghiniana.AAC.2